MTTRTQARQPKGSPVGGEFAATAGSESSVALGGPDYTPGNHPFVVDIDCFADGGLDCVEMVDFMPEVMALHPRDRSSLLNPTPEQVEALVAAARADGRLKWSGEVRANVAEAMVENVTDHFGRYRLAGWDNSAEHVKRLSDAGGPGTSLMMLASKVTSLTREQRSDIAIAYMNVDPAVRSEARRLAFTETFNCGGGYGAAEAFTQIRADASRMAAVFPSLRGGSKEPEARAVGDAAAAILAASYMRDRYLAPDARREYTDSTTTKFTLEHYDTLIGPVRGVLGSLTAKDSNLAGERDRFTDKKENRA